MVTGTIAQLDNPPAGGRAILVADNDPRGSGRYVAVSDAVVGRAVAHPSQDGDSQEIRLPSVAAEQPGGNALLVEQTLLFTGNVLLGVAAGLLVASLVSKTR
jgi:hypothetical protein